VGKLLPPRDWWFWLVLAAILLVGLLGGAIAASAQSTDAVQSEGELHDYGIVDLAGPAHYTDCLVLDEGGADIDLFVSAADEGEAVLVTVYTGCDGASESVVETVPVGAGWTRAEFDNTPGSVRLKLEGSRLSGATPATGASVMLWVAKAAAASPSATASPFATAD
jgi:hypothetical protein